MRRATPEDVIRAYRMWAATTGVPELLSVATSEAFGPLLAQAYVDEAVRKPARSAVSRPRVADEVDVDLDAMAGDVLRLSARVEHRLAWKMTVRELCAKTPADLLSMRMVGPTMVREVIAELARHGLTLAPGEWP